MPIALGGLSSGMDTNAIIDQLVQVEGEPIKRWAAEKDKYNRRKDALNELKSKLSVLNESARDIYGFRGSFNDKRAISSNQSVLDATANKLAEKGSREIKVKELASNHKISSDKINKDEKLPPGKFKIEINGDSRTVKFNGGKLDNLRDKISETASEIVDATAIKTDAENSILTLESKTPGKKGEIILSGDTDFLKKIGIIKGEKDEKKDETAIVFDQKYFTSYKGGIKPAEEDGALDVAKDGRSVKIDGILWREFMLPVSAPIKKDTILEVNMDYSVKANEEETIPFRIEIGPEEETIIKGIRLKSYNVPRIRKEEKKSGKQISPFITGIGIVALENGQRIEKLYERGKDVKGKQMLPVGNDFDGRNITSIIFYCSEGSTVFSNANITTPIKGTGQLEAKNIIKNASDAKFDVDGVEIVRDRNNGLNDVIKGVDLSLKGISDHPVTLRIEPDVAKNIDKIKKFVKSYNDYLDYNSKLIKTANITKPAQNNPDEAAKAKEDMGLFVGDMTIIKLENSLKTVLSESYPSRLQDPIRILVQTGISTGEINAQWESIRQGKLIIDENKLSNVIENNPKGLDEFFGSDTDGDNKIDNGMAYQLETQLRPYVSSGKNILISKMDLETESIKSTDEKIDRHKEHLKKYEEKLRSKFAAMEKSISDSKSQGNWLKMNLGMESDNKKD